MKKKKRLHSGSCPRRAGRLKDGFSDDLQPLKPLDLSKVRTVNDLVTQMAHTSFGGRNIGEAADVLYSMKKDKDCFVVLTISGAMTVAKMGLVISDMIDHGLAGAVVSTGALMAHGFVEAAGMAHFKYESDMDDRELYHSGYNRVYDTLELEKNLDDVEIVFKSVLDGIDRSKVLSSAFINEKLGEYLAKKTKARGILKSAYLKKVPVFVPAYTDSELGLDLGIYNRTARLKNEKAFAFDPFIDLEDFTELIKRQKKIGIFTIGGGVPRNWAQQAGPYLDIIDKRVKTGGGFKRYQYGVRICPEPVHWGGLSGCTYSEGISWGKFTPPAEGGRWAEVYADATIALPLVVKAVLERLNKGG
ncbi:MAG: deoxyhypusine synthase family protein [Candidatus Omnitrophica bacterium]|nr:deoxyhypusine synthase family protein [Candidatus Omnitrophota bacterium]